MKTLIIPIALLFLILCSCKDSNNQYSCDPTINNWVKTNISKIDEMDRKEWLQLDESKKKPAYRAFSAEQRQSLWILKLEEIVNMGGWSSEEIKHINKLKEIFVNNINWFEDGFNSNDNKVMEVEAIIYNWCNSGIEQFGWSKNFAFSIINTPNKVVDLDGNVEITKTKSTRFKSTSEAPQNTSCDCHKSKIWNDCQNLSSSSCHTSECTSKSSGCGIISLSSCDGLCKID